MMLQIQHPGTHNAGGGVNWCSGDFLCSLASQLVQFRIGRRHHHAVIHFLVTVLVSALLQLETPPCCMRKKREQKSNK